MTLTESDDLDGKDLFSEKRNDLRLKRCLDVLISLVLLALLSPLFIVLALIIKSSSRGPAIFRQRRIGLNGIEFDFLKFRSMRNSVPGLPGHEKAAILRSQGVLHKDKRDPRITWIGRIIRKTSIDELPQLLNVLKGEMSLVGPRPLIPFMLDALPVFASRRALVKPGITGLWQIRERERNWKADFMEKHDLEYIRTFSFGLDMKILVLTLPKVFSGKGAH